MVLFFSVILRKSENPHTKNLRKSDPVARFQQFRKSWDQQKAPGEKNHKNLRWNVREQMLAQDIVYEKVRQLREAFTIGPVKQKKKIAIIFLSISLNMCFGCLKEPSR